MAGPGGGQTQAGSSPGGRGTAPTVPGPQTTIYPDVATGLSRAGRLLDPATGQYVYTADGRIAGMGAVPQLVAIAFGTVKGRSAIRSLGQTYSELREKGPNWQRQLATIAHNTLSDLIAKKMVQLVSVTDTDTQPDGSIVAIVWRDLTDPMPNAGGGMTYREHRTTV